MSNKNGDYYFLKGGGEMGELIRAKDWSKTSLGNPADWPQSLQTMVSVMLDNPFGMYIAWGRDYIQLYNDGFRPILGATKHPRALGISTLETFSEIWDTISPMFEGVMKGVPVRYTDLRLHLNRNGYEEECYFDFSYSPVRKDNGEVGGVLATVIETTNKKKAEESLMESNQRFRNTMKQAPVGITILRGPQYIVEMANDSYLQLIDKKESEFVGKPLFASLPEVEKAVHSLLDNVLNTGVPYRGNEVPIPVNRYGKQDVFYFDFLYDPLKEEDGKISGVIVAVTEVTEKVEARKKIEESKRLYETITQNTPDLIYVFDLHYRFTYANEALLKMWGRTWDDAIGKGMLEIGYEPWHTEMHEREIDQVVAIKKSMRGEVSFPHATLGNRIYDYIFAPVIDQDGKVEAIAGTTRDITQQVEARKQIEASEMRFRNMVEQAPVAICVLRGENYVVEVANEKQLQLWGKTKQQVLNKPIFTAIPEGAGQGFEKLLSDVFTTGKPFIANEFPTKLIRDGKKEIFYSNFIYEPLYNGEHKIDGIISISTDVTEQVIARKKIEESERRFRLAIAGSTQIVFSQDKDLKHTWIYNTHPDLKAEDIIGKTDEDLYEPSTAAILTALKQRILNTGTAFNGDIEIELSGQKANYTMHIEAIKDTDGNITGIIGTAMDITERIKTQQKIEESEQRFQAAVQAVEGILWTNNAKGEMEGEQSGWASLTGQAYEEYQGYGWAKAVHPEDAQPTVNAWNEAVQQRKTFIFEHRVKTKDKGWRDFSIRAIPLLNADGTLIQWVGVHTDITDKKQAAEVLKANEEKLTIVIEASELGTWEIDLKSNTVAGSRRLHEIMGYPQKNSLTLTDTLKRIHPDYIQLREEAFKKACATGLFYFTGQIIWDDNSSHWIESKGKVFYDEQNNPVTIIGTTEDITAEKQQQQILLESEQKFRLLADSMPQHIWTSDPEGNLNYYNKSVFDYSGLTLEQINKDGWIQIVHPDDREENIRQWYNAVSSGKDFLFEHRFRRYDGEYRWQLSRAIPQKDKNDNIQIWVGTSTDIQDQKTREEKKDEFISIASHEMKTPLTTAKAYLQMLELFLDESNEEVRLYAKKAVQSVNRLNELISELLDVSKMQLGKLNYTITTFNFNDMVDSTVENIQLTSQTHAIIKTGKVCNEVTGDKDRLQQVVINLLSNAIKYSPLAKKVFINVEQQADSIKVSVKDTGIGIARQNLDKIFEKYHRVEEHAVHFQGLGIGLFISYEIIQRHNGKLWAESEPGKGSTFYFTLPVNGTLTQ